MVVHVLIVLFVIPKTIRIHGVEYYILSFISKEKDKNEREIMTTVVVAIEDDKNKQIQKPNQHHMRCVSSSSPLRYCFLVKYE